MPALGLNVTRSVRYPLRIMLLCSATFRVLSPCRSMEAVSAATIYQYERLFALSSPENLCFLVLSLERQSAMILFNA